MKINASLICIAVLTAGLASCSRKVEAGPELCHVTAQAACYSNTSTKTQVGSLSGENLLIDWTPGDMIGICTSNSQVSCFTNQSAEADGCGDFTGLLSGTPTVAFHPYVEDVTDLRAVPFSIPTEQIYTGPESIGQYDIRIATSVSSSAEGYRMHFNSLTSLLRFEVDLTGLVAYTEQDESEDGDGGPVGEKSAIVFDEDQIITEVNLSIGEGDGSPSLTCGTEDYFYLVDMTSGTPELTECKGEEDYTSTVNVYPENIYVSGQGTQVFYAVVAPGAVHGSEIDLAVWIESDSRSHWLHIVTPMAVDLEAGHYYTIPLKASELNGMENVICCEFDLSDEDPEEEE